MADVCKYGEPSVSGRTITPEFSAGYDGAFGPSSDEIRAPKRTTYVYRNGKCIEVGGPEDHGPEDPESDWAKTHVVSDLYMDGTTMPGPDGKPIDIGSRAKRRHYMTHDPVTGERRELADMADFNGVWAEGEKRREMIKTGKWRAQERRDVIGRRLYEAQMKDRRSR